MANRPVVAIIGRPNVGKSSLFNRLLKERQAIVAPLSGTTRDRLYAPLKVGDVWVDLVDTAGLSKDLAQNEFGPEMLKQVQQAVSEADILIFVLDATAGFTHEDQVLAEIIRKSKTKTIVFINKADNLETLPDSKLTNLGLGQTVIGSITQRRGHEELLRLLTQQLSDMLLSIKREPETEDVPRVALAGRPNVGKSTLVNALLGDERVIVSDIPGTTRDTIDSQIELSDGQKLIITDTAGIRRRGKVGRALKVEQYSVIRTLKAIDRSDIVLLLVDGVEGLTRGDVHVAMYVLEQKKRLITVINKSDLIDTESFNYRRFPFLTKHPIIFISARERTSIEPLLELISESLRKMDETPSQSSSVGTQPTMPGQ